MILAGDVGGTKTNLGMFRATAGKLVAVREGTYRSAEWPSLEAMLQDFVAQGRQKVHRIAVGVAGPVVKGRSQVVNLRWPVDTRRLSRALGVEQVWVLNDLESTAWGIPELPRSKVDPLTPGLRPGPGNAALIAAGTGLGMTLLVSDGERFVISPSEGGHQQFAPRDDMEIDLLRFARERYGRASIERIVAGPGFSVIYQFLLESGWGKESALMSRRLAEGGDANATITAAGLAGEDKVAEKTVDWFVSMYGAAAGDLALVGKATGGVWVGGGIAPKILPKMRSGAFVEAFRDKGRLKPLVEKIPIKVILEPKTALIGAAARAAAGTRGSRAIRA